MKVKIERQKQMPKRPILYIIREEETGAPIGMLEKYNNTRTTTHPWKAYSYVTEEKYLGAFYENHDKPPGAKGGGKEAAVQAIIQAANHTPSS